MKDVLQYFLVQREQDFKIFGLKETWVKKTFFNERYLDLSNRYG